MGDLILSDQVEKYTAKLLRDRTAVPESIRFYVLDDRLVSSMQDEWLDLFQDVFSGLTITTLLFAKPSVPFADLLIEREPAGDRLVPKDSEAKTFLHDLPFIRKQDWHRMRRQDRAERIVNYLKQRKAMLIQDVGVVATGGITVEQAFIAYSTVFHTTFVKYHLDLLTHGFLLPNERAVFEAARTAWVRNADSHGTQFMRGPLTGQQLILPEICRVGRYTVEKGLVDSFFGNISYFDGNTIYISQTASSLDELEGHIDPVPLDGSSTAGISASSELPAHKAIYVSSPYHAVLHGHPKFSVILSMHCDQSDCTVQDCGKNCTRSRSACGIPIVSGEIGAGGLAKTVPVAVQNSGICIVYGHGVFAAGKQDFKDAFINMLNAENRCRSEYFSLLAKRSG